MSRFTLEREISADPASVYAHLVDPTRLRRWLPWTEAIERPSGPLDRAGTTFAQRGAKGIRRPGGVVAADPPRFWHLRIAGYGERVDLEFSLEPVAGGTRLRVDGVVRNGPGAVGAIVDVFAGRIDRRSWVRAIERLAADVERPAVPLDQGDVVTVEGGGIVRVAQVLDQEPDHVHLRLFSGRWPSRAAPIDVDALGFARPKDHFAVQPLLPTIRAAAFSPTRGALSVLADGGLGVGHVPMTRQAFDDAEPLLVGRLDVPEGHTDAIRRWRASGGAAFGEDREPAIGALYLVALQALGLETIGWGVVKLLRQEFRGVHLRVYSNVFVERPASLDEDELVSRPVPPGPPVQPMTEPLAIGHLPVRHTGFVAWKPEFRSTTLVDPDELMGYETWRLEKGGFF